jgi:CubicO group peptidase (beta-lactamase class C family)
MAPGSTGFFDRVRERIRAQLLEQALPSLAVAVARDGVVLWEEGFGWADRANRIPATPHTLYSLASISKPITTTGLMILHERSLFDLDRPIDEYLGDAKLTARVGSAADATVRRVANHTAGLPMHYQFFYADQPHRPPPFDETIRRYANLISMPGERYQYSNLGYGLLDYMIARLSGHSYADFMRREVFLPLGMTHASVDIGAGLESFQAIRYGADGISYPFYDFDHPGGSAVFCSAHDLARFGMFHLKAHLDDQKAILSDETIDAMQIGSAQVAEQRSYAIGWSINEDNYGYRSVGHSGGMGGVSTSLIMVPAERIVVVILANANTALSATLAEEILADLLPAYAEKRAAQRSAPDTQATQAQPDVPEWIAPTELLGTWRGTIHTYQGDFALTLWVKESGDIHAQIGDQLRALVNRATYDAQQQTFSGRMHGTIATDDARRRPHELQLDLKLRDQRLNGALYAIGLPDHDEGGAPDRRLGSAIGYWAELGRTMGEGGEGVTSVLSQA